MKRNSDTWIEDKLGPIRLKVGFGLMSGKRILEIDVTDIMKETDFKKKVQAAEEIASGVAWILGVDEITWIAGIDKKVQTIKNKF